MQKRQHTFVIMHGILTPGLNVSTYMDEHNLLLGLCQLYKQQREQSHSKSQDSGSHRVHGSQFLGGKKHFWTTKLESMLNPDFYINQIKAMPNPDLKLHS